MPQQRLGRSWGSRFNSLTSSESLSSNLESGIPSPHPVPSSPRSVSADEGNGTARDSHDRIQPDASIFIGSLPCHIEHADLTHMLAQHLSEHPQVKGIKVVRDSKGGTCAFIQCQDAEAASVLLNNLHVAPPQPFLGRYLRYEPARAFRTLIISYRSPRQYIRPRDPSRKTNFLPAEEARIIELPLPDAMRITRTPGTKHLSIQYNSAALDVQPTGGSDPNLLLVPVLFDAETLFRIASVFGAIDHFGPYVHQNEHGQVLPNFPVPHDGLRAPVMDPGCWRVKWTHRDDCVSALVTLRKVPHLTVTWAHQLNTVFRDQGFYYPRPLLGIQASHSWRGQGAAHPLRSASSFLPVSQTYPALRTAYNHSIAEQSPDCQVMDPSNDWQQDVSPVPDNRNAPPSRQSRPRAISLTHDRPQPTASLPSRESTGQLSFTNWEATNRTRWADHIGTTELKNSPSVARPTLNSSPYLAHHIASSDSSCHTSRSDSQGTDAGISHTHDFGTSPVTPRTPGSLMLRTPTAASYMGDFQSMSSLRDCESHCSLPQFSHEKRDDHIVDPTTIFVGGLEMFGPNAWDEGKVRALFSKYGGIEGVKVIRPSNKRSAFAFVKFNNTEAPARAVKAEHNRMLDGRLIRVQLRDWNPAYRPSWRSGPNKEPGSQPMGAGDEFGVDPKLPEPGITDVAAQMADLQVSGSPNQLAPPSSSEACSLNEVQDEASAKPLVAPCIHNSVCESDKEVCGSLDIKQNEPAQSDSAFVSAQISAMPAPALPAAYPAPAIQYYPGWIPNYTPQFPYQTPFSSQPYPPYSFPLPVPPPPTQSGGPDNGGVPSNNPIPIVPTSTTLMPYPSLHIGHGPDSGQATTGHAGVTNHPALLHPQAPLIPTGFIQGDQGMLVPVYPPDALNQYMTGNQDQAPNADGQPPVSWRPYPAPSVYPQALVFHSYVNPPLAVPPPHLGAHAWIQGQNWHGVAPQFGNPPGLSGRRISPSPAGASASIPIPSSFERGLVPPRRQFRRDNHGHKNNFARAMTGRVGKGPFDASRSPSDIQTVSASQVNVPDTPADANWQRWGSDQGNPA